MLPAVNAILAFWNALSPSTRKTMVNWIQGAPDAIAAIVNGDPVDLEKLPPLPTEDELNAAVDRRREELHGS